MLLRGSLWLSSTQHLAALGEEARTVLFLNALEMCPLLLDIYQLLITAGTLISSKYFETLSDLGTTYSKLNSGKARQALHLMPLPVGMDGQLMGLMSLLFKGNLLFPLRKSKCLY